MALTTIPVELLTLDDGVTISTADNDAQLILVSTDADANIAPLMQFYRNSDTPADNDQIGRIEIYGENDNDEKILYSEIVNQIKDASDGSEDGRMAFNVMTAGTAIARMDILPTETVFNEGKHDVDFRVESDGIANMLFVDAGNDRVMIGGNDPEVTFEVDSGSANTVAQFTSTDAYALIKFKDNDTSTETTLGALDNDMVFRVGDAERMRIASSGNVAIGRTGTSNADTDHGINLYASGLLYLFGDASGNTDVFRIYNSSGTLKAAIESDGDYIDNSDARLKENIEDAASVLNTIKNMKVRSFDWIEGSRKQSYGFVAQELKDVVPEATKVPEVEDEPWGVRNSRIVPMLTKAIQEQQTLIETLEAKVKALEEA